MSMTIWRIVRTQLKYLCLFLFLLAFSNSHSIDCINLLNFKSSFIIIEIEIQFNSTIEINSTIELNFAFKLVEFNLKFNPNQIQFNLVKINQIPINLIEFGWNEIEFHQMQFKLDWIGVGFEIQINSICLNWIFWVELLFWKF
jgi:hypothetical protein